jgi:cytosine/adenosine deaminase-related metal-dependent hydrolase
VQRRCGTTTVSHFEHLGLLQPVTCLAHCVWVGSEEARLLRERQVKVLHCPSSNLKLGSGIARIPEFLSSGVTVSLGADGAPCNNTLDMFHEMRLAALIQKPLHGPTALDARSVFELATRGGAAALGLGHVTGSIEEGKKADLVLLDLNRMWNPLDQDKNDTLYSTIVFSGSPANVCDVMVDGRWLVRSRALCVLDEGLLVRSAREELRRLLGRAEV